MADLTAVNLKAAEGYHYDPSPQRTEGWYARRIGKVSASRLEDFLSVSKAESTKGAKLQKRLDYELELQYEKQFNVSYNNYVSDAMNDGVILEDFALKQLSEIIGKPVTAVGCWYNDNFVASPDGAVGDDALAEAKVLRDASFSALLAGTLIKGKKAKKAKKGEEQLPDTPDRHVSALSEEGKHSKFWKQMQGQLRASGRKYCWFVAVNMNTRKVYIERIERDETFMEWLDLNLTEIISKDTKPFEDSKIFEFRSEPPAYVEGGEDFNF